MATGMKKRSVAYQIEHQKGASHDLILSELLGSELESGQRADASGDQGTSFGIFQIHLPAHPGITKTEAESVPTALKLWRSSYQSAVDKIGAAAFKQDPERAAEEAADLAERPAQDYYTARGTSTVNYAYGVATKEIKTGHGGGDASITPLGGGQTLPIPAGNATVTEAEQHAAKVLSQTNWDGAKLSGNNLLVTLAALGAQTKGTYDEKTLNDFVAALHADAIPDSDLLTNHYSEVDPYLASAQAALAKIGLHPKYTGNPDGGDPGRTQAGIHAPDPLAGLDSIGTLIKWVTNPENLLRVGLIALGAVLIIVGVIRLSGGSVPSAVPVPVPV